MAYRTARASEQRQLVPIMGTDLDNSLVSRHSCWYRESLSPFVATSRWRALIAVVLWVTEAIPPFAASLQAASLVD